MNGRERDILIQRMLDGEISPEEFEVLQDLLLADAKARRRYYEYVGLQQALTFHYARSQERSASVAGLGSKVREVQQRRSFRRTIVAAAAMFVLAAVVLRLIPAPDPEPVVSFRTAVGTEFELSHSLVGDEEPPAPGTLAVGSSINLTRGSAELTLATGVVSIVQAPAQLTVHGKNRVFLPTGTAWFRVPEDAHGFQVITRELEITDLGTEFGVVSRNDAHDEAHCIHGKIVVRARSHLKEEETLHAGQARHPDPIGRIKAAAFRPGQFLTRLPTGTPFLHWAFDSVEGGTFPVDGDHPAAGFIKSSFTTGGNPVAASLRPGRFGKALYFDGCDNHLLTDWPGIPGDAPRSVALWVRMPKDLTSKAIILGWGTQQVFPEPSNLKWTIGLSPYGSQPLVPVIGFGGSRYYAHETSITDGKWHHFAAVYKGGGIPRGSKAVDFYVDGRLTPTVFHTAVGRDHAGVIPIETRPHTPLVMGTGLSDRPDRAIEPELYRFRGGIDELYIFSDALDAGEVRALMTRNHPGP